MTSHNRNGSWKMAMQRLNIITAGLMMVFAVCGLVMTGLAGEVITVLEEYSWMPFSASLVALCGVFLSSGTRDPTYYHPVEKAFVGAVVLLMAAQAFYQPVADEIAKYEPWGAILVLVVMIIASAILAR